MAFAAATVDGWAFLPGHLVVDIAARTLKDSTMTYSVEDFNAFRAVCSNWRAAATKDVLKANYSGWRFPYLMLAEKEGTSEREIFNPVTGKVCGKLYLPELAGKRCIDSRFGWLLVLANSGEAELLNPISGSKITLPSYKSFPGYLEGVSPPFRFIRRAVLSASPSDSSEFVLMVHSGKKLGFWRNGEEKWTEIEVEVDVEAGLSYRSIEDMAFSEKNKVFYIIGTVGHVWKWDPKGPARVEWVFGVCPYYTGTIYNTVQGYLMDYPFGEDVEMLMVTRNGRCPHGRQDYVYGATVFNVFKINFGDVDERRGISYLPDLENDASIFVGHNAAVCVQVTSEFPDLFRSNCIYFSDDSTDAYLLSRGCEGEEDEGYEGEDGGDEQGEGDEGDDHDHEIYFDWVSGSWNLEPAKGGGKDMGVYDIGDASIERFGESAETLSSVCPPLWISPASLFAV